MSFAETSKSVDTVAAALIANSNPHSRAGAGGVYRVECVGSDGSVKWTEEIHNLVVNEGLQNMVATYLDASTQTAIWYLGLITGPGSGTTISANDTLPIHGGWTEFSNYSGVRKTVVFGTATTASPSVIGNSASPASFVITAPGGTIAGAFLCSVSSGTSGILFSAADFQAPGDRVVTTGDTINVTYTFSLSAL
jgi:hypothetical protein